MIINKLILKDFGAFEGKNCIDFNIVNSDKNIILIGGKNGAGKTTVFTAIKLALYGHLTFGYKTVHQTYLNRVKKYINSKSLSKDQTETYICIEFTLPKDRELLNYYIKRSWKYVNSQLQESLVIKLNGSTLNDNEVFDFENYLVSVIPPKLFDFFFFDGENLADFFNNQNRNKNIKDSILTLTNLDTFEIMKKYILHYKNKHLKNTAYIDEQSQYNNLQEKLKELDSRKSTLQVTIDTISKKLTNLNLEKIETEKEFKKLGGLMVSERDKLVRKLNTLEKQKEEKQIWLKNFANTLLPFVITKKLIKNIKIQINKEEQYNSYKVVINKINENFLEDIIKKNFSSLNSNLISHANELAVTLSKGIHKSLEPPFDIDKFKVLHDLSKDEKTYVLDIINNIETISPDIVQKIFFQINKINSKIKEIKDTLKINDKNLELKTYITRIQKLNNNINNLTIKQKDLQNKLLILEEEILKTKTSLEKSYEKVIQYAKNINSVKMSNNIENIIDAIINTVIKNKIQEIKSNFMSILTEIIRKDNYIDDIEINNNLEITVYRNTNYTAKEILNIFQKIGKVKFIDEMGSKCVQTLESMFNKTSLDELIEKLKDLPETHTITLPVKIKVDSLSKGEQQIYILSLYWSLAKLSKYDIPFIIDTPYARIDSSHRDNITTKFFPKLGRQVIILSTDEEINEEYYMKIKKYIAHEYLITYDEKENRSYIDKKYFFEVKQ